MLNIQDTVDKYKDDAVPAGTQYPAEKAFRSGYAGNVKKSVERAVGADILFRED